ncbi:hypothetical protein MRB53_038962 [Persea americana]|nr:hypothetical protein MRB53_038962 [Persea americana]
MQNGAQTDEKRFFRNFCSLYNHAGLVVCADAGANRLYDLLLSNYSDLTYDVALAKFLPNNIHGDLDSISDKVKHANQALGVEITQDGDQYSTDFQKAVRLIQKAKPKIANILVTRQFECRIDQGIGLLHELYREQCIRQSDIKYWLISETSVSVILEPGTTRLATNSQLVSSLAMLAFLPIYGPASITTHGLEWDVTEWKTEMGWQCQLEQSYRSGCCRDHDRSAGIVHS